MDTNAQKELGRNKMEDIVITEEMVKKQTKKMNNWTAEIWSTRILDKASNKFAP